MWDNVLEQTGMESIRKNFVVMKLRCRLLKWVLINDLEFPLWIKFLIYYSQKLGLH